MNTAECRHCGAAMQEATVAGTRVLRCPWVKADGSHAEVGTSGFICDYRPASAREISGKFIHGPDAPQRGSR